MPNPTERITLQELDALADCDNCQCIDFEAFEETCEGRKKQICKALIAIRACNEIGEILDRATASMAGV